MRPSYFYFFVFFLSTEIQLDAADIVLDWNKTIRKVTKSDGKNDVNLANPGWSTRSMAMMNGAIYDAFQAVNRTHTPYLADTTAVPNTSLDVAVHQAAYEILLHCYAGESAILGVDYADRMSLIADGTAKTNGIALGHSIAQTYINDPVRMNDHSLDMVPYTPGTNPGEWQVDPYHPTQSAWGPGWKNVTPFAIPNTTDFVNALPPIPTLTSQAYADAFEMVKTYGDLNSVMRTSEQTEIGLFWAYDRASMGPPPVLFNRSVSEIAMQAGNSPEENARLFAMVSIAQADAAISAWDTKFEYNFWRPVTAIHQADLDGNLATVKDENWRPMGAPGADPNDFEDDFTPPFPAWTSGHATMGGAVFKALELFYGTNNFDEIDGILGNNPMFYLTSEESGSGSMRTFTTFTQDGPLGVGMENSPEGENGMSRIYLGIHWIFDQQDGISLGNNIATFVQSNYFQPVPEPSTLVLVVIGIVAVLPILIRGLKSPALKRS